MLLSRKRLNSEQTLKALSVEPPPRKQKNKQRIDTSCHTRYPDLGKFSRSMSAAVSPCASSVRCPGLLLPIRPGDWICTRGYTASKFIGNPTPHALLSLEEGGCLLGPVTR